MPAVSLAISSPTLIVCTVLTGTREIASEEKMWPPTWNAAIGSVPFRIAFVGVRSLPVRLSCRRVPTQHSAETKANWTIVRVTGNLKLLRMTLPVLLDTALVAYHNVHSRTNRTVCALGRESCEASACIRDDMSVLSWPSSLGFRAIRTP